MSETRKLKIFLCHSKDDKPKVRELYRRLVADGYDPWLDEEKLMPGQDWDLEIRKAVRESDVVVVCLSNGSITKAGYVQKEIRFALDVADEQPEGAIYLIPARLDDCDVPLRLNKWQWVNLFENNGFIQLVASLEIRAKGLEIKRYLSFDFEPQMMQIPAGMFLMGPVKENVQQTIKSRLNELSVEWKQSPHPVELSEFYIGKYPITNREYQAFVRDAKYKPPKGWDRSQFPTEKGSHPVVNVSWGDTVEYCEWLSEKTKKNYRLPTEAEWEKAARGTDGRRYPWGNEPLNDNLHNVFGDTIDVGCYSPQTDSPYGCSDMVGHVWQWTMDHHGDNRFIIRGGGFMPWKHMLGSCDDRTDWGPLGYKDIGFRIVLKPL